VAATEALRKRLAAERLAGQVRERWQDTEARAATRARHLEHSPPQRRSPPLLGPPDDNAPDAE
jgi:hypothetical protein